MLKMTWDLFDVADNQHGVQQAAANLKHRLQEFRNINADAQVGVISCSSHGNDTRRLPHGQVLRNCVSVNGKVNDADLDYTWTKLPMEQLPSIRMRLDLTRIRACSCTHDAGISFAKELKRPDKMVSGVTTVKISACGTV